MKTNFQILTLAMTAIAICVGCDPKPVKRIEYTPPTVPDIKIQLPNIDSSESQKGGQPGIIKLSKNIAVEDSDGIVRQKDSRIQLQLVGGKGIDGQASVVERKKATGFALQSETSTLADTDLQNSRAGSYINMGCKNIDASLITGLTEIKMRFSADGATLTGSAEKMFFCGPRRGAETFAAVDADEIYLTDVNYAMRASLLGLMITTKKLILKGKNRLATRGIFSPNPGYYPGAMIVLDVKESIQGDGTLLLSTTGASYRKAKGLPGDK
jgi:hypothetical protein